MSVTPPSFSSGKQTSIGKAVQTRAPAQTGTQDGKQMELQPEILTQPPGSTTSEAPSR